MLRIILRNKIIMCVYRIWSTIEFEEKGSTKLNRMSYHVLKLRSTN